MMGDFSRKLTALYGALSTFLILFVTISFYISTRSKQRVFEQLIQERIYGVPLILYVLGISLLAAALLFVIITFTQRAQLRRLEEKIHLLASGSYDNPYLKKRLALNKNDVELQNIDDDLNRIAKQVNQISAELQVLSSRPQMVDGTTKEEILEGERKRLARELHDSVSQQLFAAMMMLSALTEQSEKQDFPELFKKQLNMVTTTINASQSEMRALLLHLRPINLEGKSLKKGIEQLLKELQTKIQIELKWEVEDVKLASGVEDHLFRVVQELMSNTLRHAKAKTLEVYLHQIGDNVMLRFIDDGVGFDLKENANKAGSYGLNNMRERISSLGGTFKLISFKGQGTSVEIKVPVTGPVEKMTVASAASAEASVTPNATPSATASAQPSDHQQNIQEETPND